MNHFGGSVGGPIVATSCSSSSTANGFGSRCHRLRHHGSPASFQSYVLQQLPLGGEDAVTGSIYQPRRNWFRSTKKMFSLFDTTDWHAAAVLGCPFGIGGLGGTSGGCGDRISS